MATIKVKLRPSSIAGKAGTVCYQIRHGRQTRQIASKIHLLPREWDPGTARPAAALADARTTGDKIDRNVCKLRMIAEQCAAGGETYSIDDIVRRFHGSGHRVTLCAFMREQIGRLRMCNRLGTAQNYECTMQRFVRFLGGDIALGDITGQTVEQFSAYLGQCGVVRNTVSFYMRILRSVYNKAVLLGYARQTFPFRNVYTGIDRTRKRAVGESIIARLAGLDLTGEESLSLTRDMFLFSFYTRGMSFVDMVYLRHENIRGGRIRYIRRKTGQKIEIREEPPMREIIGRYADEGRSPYVFPVLRGGGAAEDYKAYRVAASYYNRLLKRLCDIAGIRPGLTFYTARHSWATAARNHHIPVSVISAGMGHTSEHTTQIYLAMIENSVIDDANRGILDALRHSGE